MNLTDIQSLLDHVYPDSLKFVGYKTSGYSIIRDCYASKAYYSGKTLEECLQKVKDENPDEVVKVSKML